MFCCGEQRNGKFCQECGTELIADTVKRNLANYLNRQAKTVRKNIDNRLAYNPEIEESTLKQWNDKIKKWEEWRDWVLSATPPTEEQEW